MLNQHFKFGDINPTHYFLVFGLFLTIIFTSIGGNDEATIHPALHFFQWSLNVFIPLITLIMLQIGLQKNQGFDQLNPWVKLLLTGILSSILFTPVAYLIDLSLGTDPKPTSLIEWRLGLFQEFSDVLLPLVSSWLIMNAPWVLGLSLTKDSPEPLIAKNALSNIDLETVSIADQDSQSLFDIPTDEILYLKAEQHYLRIVTANGSKLVLYNLKDAILDLPSESGIQTHRSYWVAFKHIQKLESRKQQRMLRMSNHDLVPISRRNVNSVKSAFKNLLL